MFATLVLDALRPAGAAIASGKGAKYGLSIRVAASSRGSVRLPSWRDVNVNALTTNDEVDPASGFSAVKTMSVNVRRVDSIQG